MSRLFLLFVVVPLIELMLLIQVGRWIGLWPTLAIVLGTGALGAALARREGLRTAAKLQSELAAGRLPGGALMDGAAILVGGALLLTPGVLTDLVGLSLLFPPTRSWIRSRALKWFERSLRDGTMNVRVIGFGPGGLTGFGGSGAASGAGPEADDPGAGPRHRKELDPSKEIRQDER